MSFEKFPEPIIGDSAESSEKTPERVPEKEREEKILAPEEIEQLGQEMHEYIKGLRERINEIKKELETETDKERKAQLEEELEDLQEQCDGLTEFADDIESGDYEEITER